MYNDENEGLNYEDSQRPADEDRGSDEKGTNQGSEVEGEPGHTNPAATANSFLLPAEQEKRTITDLLYGVIARPVDTLRYIADNKLVLAGILTYIAVALVGYLASIPTALNEFNRMSELGRLPFNPRIMVITPVFTIPILGPILLVIICGIFHVIAGLFKGKGDFNGLLSSFGFSYFPSILMVPFTLLELKGGIVGSALSSVAAFGFSIWLIVLYTIAIRENYKFSTGRAVATFFIPVITFIVLIVVLVLGLVALSLNSMGPR
ncbi:MAG TPA: Yip1 family protein [Anaerolineae bacterium]|nr:Yip1 family protein [Anaerolineae bacterium]